MVNVNGANLRYLLFFLHRFVQLTQGDHQRAAFFVLRFLASHTISSFPRSICVPSPCLPTQGGHISLPVS